MRRVIPILALIVAVALPAGASAQTPEGFEWYPGGTYDPSIPTPASFLGYEIGNDYTPYHRMRAYLEAVARASDRVTVRPYGTTNEGRALLLLTITSPSNRARLEEIRQGMATLADPRGVPQERLDAIIERSPAVAWLSYNVHGNESASTEAAILTVYQLAAGTDALTAKLLDELVIIIDPLQNPDGRERFVNSFRQRFGSRYNANPDAWEHSSDWPGGRTNHFYFDLNRDWSWQTQVETQQRTVEYLKWNPVVHVDFHEMGGDSYFFFPAATPVHKAIPDVTIKWHKIYGEGNAAAFDSFGWPYYTRVGFDMFYPGFGDSWPSMMGAIGMTYEQGGGGGVAIAIEREDGTVHSLRQRVHGHFTTSIATLKTTADRRKERLADFLTFFRQAIDLGKGSVKAYAFVPAADPYNADRLVKLLTRQGIEVHEAASSFRARVTEGFGVYPAPNAREFPAGTYVAVAGQPKGVALRMLLEPMPALEDTSFYDLAGWSLPLVYNVEAYALSQLPDVELSPVTEIARRNGGVQGERAAYAYAIPYEGTSALLAAVDLLNRGVRVRSAGESFTIRGRSYPAGSFVIPVYRNPEDLHAIVDGVARERGLKAYPLDTGLVEEGIDLGAGAVRRLKKPRIAVAAGRSAGSSFGEVWNFFDQRFPYFDYTNVDASRLGRIDLEKYDVLILPSASYGDLFGEEGIARLRRWLQAGGVVIGFDGGAQFLSRDGAKLTSISTQSEQRSDKEEEKDQPAVEARQTLAERRRESKVNRRPGGMFGVVLDPGHWLAFGMPTEMAILKRGRRSFAIAERGVNVAVFTREPLLSGYAPAEWPEELSKRAWLVVENVGRGKAVLFADDPLFRMLTEGEYQLLLNAIVLGPGY